MKRSSGHSSSSTTKRLKSSHSSTDLPTANPSTVPGEQDLTSEDMNAAPSSPTSSFGPSMAASLASSAGSSGRPAPIAPGSPLHNVTALRGNGSIGRGPAKPARKLTIRPLKVAPKLPADFEDTTWTMLSATIDAIHSQSSTTFSEEQLFQAVEALCLHKFSSNLYQRLAAKLEEHIRSLVNGLVGLAGDSRAFLDVMDRTWREHCNAMIHVRSIFLYLDRTYVLKTPVVSSIWDLGLGLFRVHVMSHPEVQSKTLSGLSSMIEAERRGDAVNTTLLRSLVQMLPALGVYRELFEGPFLEATSAFYSQEGLAKLDSTDVPSYLKYVETRLGEENARVSNYLDSSTKNALIGAVEKHLLADVTGAIIDKGLAKMMDADALDDLKRLYVLMGRVSATAGLKAAFVDHVKARGRLLVVDPERDSEMVTSLLHYKSRMDAILQTSFFGNELFSFGLQEAFEGFINQRQNKPAEMVAKFVDASLKSGNKGSSEQELEALLDRVMVIFRYIQGKDVFEAFYKKDLAKRLLMRKSASTDMEKVMITKLRTECGSSFTNKLEGMFKDVDLSEDIARSFQQAATVQDRLRTLDPNVAMHVFVLTQAYWPPYPPMEVKMPPKLGSFMEVFKEFYLSKHSGRRLHWQHSLGSTVLRAHFGEDGRTEKELQVSFFQTLVLLLFNDAQRLTWSEILEATGIEVKELRRTLQSLACGKVRPIVKEPKGRDVNDTDSFVFNQGLQLKLFRARINSIQMKETEEEQTKTQESVIQDRQYQIDAAVVRIMKARKTLSHALLMTELFQQLKFPIAPGDMKKRIESLIEREYMERDKSASNVYKYMA